MRQISGQMHQDIDAIGTDRFRLSVEAKSRNIAPVIDMLADLGAEVVVRRRLGIG